MFPHTPGDRVLMECCRSVLDCWYLWCRQQRCWDEQLGPLQEVFVLRKAFYLSETKVDCARDLYGPMHKTCMQAYDLCLFFMEDGSNAYLHCSSGACRRQGDMLFASVMFRWLFGPHTLETDCQCSEFRTCDHIRRKKKRARWFGHRPAHPLCFLCIL